MLAAARVSAWEHVERAWTKVTAMAVPAGRRAMAWLRDRRPAIEAALEDRSRWVTPIAGVAGLALGAGVIIWVVSGGRHSADTEVAAKSAAAAQPSSPALSARAGESESLAAPAAAPLAPCTIAGERRTLAPKALVPAGVEARTVGNSLAVGFASSDHQGVAERLDPATLSTIATANARSKDVVRRVTPRASGKDGVEAVVDADRRSDALAGRRTVGADPVLQVGAGDHALQWAKGNGAPAGRLWELDGDGDVDAIHAVSEDAAAGRTTGIVFRRANAVNVGFASGLDTLAPQGSLLRFVGSGPAIGSPAIALQDGVAFVAWADRASQDEPWRVRWARFRQGEAPGEPVTLVPPGGGSSEQTMSPTIIAVPGRRFLLVWTEGPQARHDVRALTLSEDGTPIGAPLVVSAQGSNAGQAQAAITSSGRGLIAFLESTDDGFEVTAAPIACGVP
jgi:hypothetical protein